MNKNLLSILLSTTALTLTITGSSIADSVHDPFRDSGIRSLELTLGKLNVRRASSEVAKLAEKFSGSSLEGLAAMAKKKGLHAAVAKVGLVDLSTIKTPMIAMLVDSRFVVISSDPSGKLSVIDPSSKGFSIDEFKSLYTGLALMVSRQPIPPHNVNGPDLRCFPYKTDFGTVNSGDKVEKTLRFQNVGNQDLIIAYARPTCGCAVSKLSSNCIAPNGTGEIKVVLDTKGRQGAQEHKIYINSNDPVLPIAQVRLVGMVISEKVALYPRNVDFGILRKNESSYREVNVYDSGGYDLKVTKVVADSPYVNCSVSSVGDARSPRYLLLLTLSPDTPIGEFKGKVTITTTHPKEPVVEVPISAIVKDSIGAPTMQVMLNTAIKGHGSQQSITLYSSRKTPLRITRIDNKVSYLKVKQTKGKECQISFEVDKNAPVGQLRGDVILNTPDPRQPVLVLRVFGMVSD